MTRLLFIINDPPYGTERAYNALRLAYTLAKRGEHSIRVFLIGAGAACARRGQAVPKGYYNIETMLGAMSRRGGEIGVCGSCMDVRGLDDASLVDGSHRSTMDELADWTVESERVLVF